MAGPGITTWCKNSGQSLTRVIHPLAIILCPPTNRSTASINSHGHSPVSNGSGRPINFAYVIPLGNFLQRSQNRKKKSLAKRLRNLAKHIQTGRRENDTVCKVIFHSWSRTGVCVCVCVCRCMRALLVVKYLKTKFSI